MKISEFRPEGNLGCGTAGDVYARCCPDRVLRRWLLVRLDGRAERIKLLEDMAERYKEQGVLAFENGPDDVLMLSFDGTLSQMRQMFQVAEDASVYANSAFDGVVGIELTELARHTDQQLLFRFLHLFHDTCAYAAVVFFLSENPSRREEKLAEKLAEQLDGVYGPEQQPDSGCREEIIPAPGFAV